VLRAIAGHVAAWPQRQIRQIRWACTDRIQPGLFLTWFFIALRPSYDLFAVVYDDLSVNHYRDDQSDDDTQQGYRYVRVGFREVHSLLLCSIA
jgi:hypothetical protein